MKIGGITKTYIDSENFLKSINQELAFQVLLNYYPEINSPKYYSIFRPKDKSPDCRFEYKNGILYFIDNAGFNNKVFFTCIDVARFLKDLSFLDAMHYLLKELKVSVEEVGLSPSTHRSSFKPEVRFTYLPFIEENNIYLSKYDITIDHIKEDKETYIIDNYWCNTKKDPNRLLIDRFGSANKNVLGYVTSDKIKLHFTSNKGKKRFYTNIENELFNISKLDKYLANDKPIVLTKSKKECLYLEYILGVNPLGLQRENQVLESSFIDKLKSSGKLIFSVFDNDNTGRSLTEIYKNEFNIPGIIIPIEREGDTDLTDFRLSTSKLNVQKFFDNEKEILKSKRVSFKSYD